MIKKGCYNCGYKNDNRYMFCIKCDTKLIDAKKLKEESRVKKISILVFIWSALLFFVGLQYDFLDEYDIILFWLPILLMIGTIVYQIFVLKNNKFVLIEIFLVYLFLHLIYMVGYYGLRGSDSYMDYNILKGILNNHNFSLGQFVQGYPMIHIFSSTVSLIGKINPMLIAKFLPSLISSLIVLPIYLLSSKVIKDKRVALFSCLIFGTIPQFMSFETAFIREVFAIFVMILFFYLVYRSRQGSDFGFYLLVFILIPVSILSHHLTSLLLLSLLSIYLVVSKVTPYVYKFILFFYHKGTYLIAGLSGKIDRRVLLIFLAFSVSLFSYWLYLYGLEFGINFISAVFYDAFGVSYEGGTFSESMSLGSPIVTLKGNIIFYGFFIYHSLFSILLIIKIFMKDIGEKTENISFIMFYFYCMFLSFMGMFFLTLLAFPDRFLPFALMFGLIPLTGLMLVLKKNVYKKILVVLLISFIIFNLYNIDSNNYTYNASYTGGTATEENYLIAKKISFPDKYYGHIGVVGAIYDLQGIEQRSGGQSLNPKFMVNFSKSSTMAVINEAMYFKDLKNLKEKSIEDYTNFMKMLSYKNDKDVDKICDLGDTYIIKGGR